MSRYYYKNLTKDNQAIYLSIFQCCKPVSPSVRLPLTDTNALAEIFTLLKLDEPSLFYVTAYKYRYTQGADHIEFSPEYIFEKSKIPSHINAIDTRIKRLIEPVRGASELEKIKYIHDFLCASVTYDKLKKNYSHEVIGPLSHGIGVCEGIAKTAKLLCDALGIECIVVLCENDPEHGIKYRHAWNIVNTGGKYYHMDATFDNTLCKCGEIRYDYLLLDDSRIFRDHLPSIWHVPQCSDSGGLYYKTAKLSFTRPEEISKRIESALRKKKNSFVFHWRGGYLNREILIKILSLCSEKAAAKGKFVSASVNFPQAVVCLKFGDIAVEPIVAEEANESVTGGESISTDLS